MNLRRNGVYDNGPEKGITCLYDRPVNSLNSNCFYLLSARSEEALKGRQKKAACAAGGGRARHTERGGRLGNHPPLPSEECKRSLTRQ